MAEPVAPGEPFVPPHVVTGHVPPQPYAPPVGAMPGAPPGGMAMPGAPYSEVVGRQLSSDETTWSMLAHLGGIVLGFLAPLVVMLAKGNESPYTKRNAVDALNFQITVLIGYVLATVLSFVLIGFILFPLLWVANVVFCILAGMAANKGNTYKYPATLRLVK